MRTLETSRQGRRRPWLTDLAVVLPLLSACGDADSRTKLVNMVAPAQPVTVGDRPAFPGAEGHGRLSQGGRGGRIIPVSSLNDSGPGTLRACIDAAGPRVCIFRVGGVIRYVERPPIIRHPYLTIAGETAPGDGILITHSGGRNGLTPLVIKNTHDVVVRHIRVRIDLPGEQRASNDGVLIENSRNVIIDHVSASWAQDEIFDGHGQNDNITVSWSILAEGVPRHDKCALLGSDPTGPQRFSFIRNLCAHNGDRNPDINFMPGSCVEMVNNVLYNAGMQFTEVWESYGGTPVSIVGNYYKRGPSTGKGAAVLDRQTIASRGQARIYRRGNVSDGEDLKAAPSFAAAEVDAPACPLVTDAIDARQSYRDVLQSAGAFPRDTVDRRIVDEVHSRAGAIGRDNRVLPALDPGEAYADADGDGMSDAWEEANRTAMAVADAWKDRDGDGWANIEEFLHYAHRQRLNGLPPR